MIATDPPFSAKIRGKHRHIDEEFPASARIGLFHILHDLIDRSYVDNWGKLARELQRIGRLPPEQYLSYKVSSMNKACDDTKNYVSELSWQSIYDFCERLHDHLAVDVGYQDGDYFHVEISKHDVKEYISAELRRLFLEEDLAYDFFEGKVTRRGRKHTVTQAARAQVVLGDTRLTNARVHYAKALKFFRESKNPDYENAVKEAVCACEAAGLSLFSEANASTLGDLAKWLANSRSQPIPKALSKSITAIYAYRNGGMVSATVVQLVEQHPLSLQNIYFLFLHL